MMRHEAQSKDVTLTGSLPDIDDTIQGDEQKVTQIVLNLVSNGIKYNRNSSAEIIIDLVKKNNRNEIYISDNGIGIAKEHLPRLFERFYRTDKGRDRESGGTGLGLSIVKHILEAHNQTINVRSTIGVGSTFSFTLKKA